VAAGSGVRRQNSIQHFWSVNSRDWVGCTIVTFALADRLTAIGTLPPQTAQSNSILTYVSTSSCADRAEKPPVKAVGTQSPPRNPHSQWGIGPSSISDRNIADSQLPAMLSHQEQNLSSAAWQ
jgi:hypothetical protein